MDKLFSYIYQSIKQWKILFFLLLALLIGGCIYFISGINFKEDITDVLPKNANNDIISKVYQQLDFSDKIIVMITAKEDSMTEKLPLVASQFLDSIQQDSSYFTDIQGKVETQKIDQLFSFVNAHLPLFLTQKDYEHIANRISKDSIQERIQNDYQTLISPTGLFAREFILKDPLGLTFIGLEKLRKAGISKNFTLNNGFVSTKDKRTLLLFVTPTFPGTDTQHNEHFVHQLDSYRKSINQQYKTAEISYFGSAFISLANANQIKSDIKTTIGLAVTALMLILIFFYRRIYIPFILFIPAICGAAISLAILHLMDSSISAISISIGAVLLGVTLDYALHIITHYREHSNVKELYKAVALPLLGCSVTTAISFSCLLFVESEVLQDLGIFAAISVFLAAVFALILIPHLYKPNEKDTLKRRYSLIDRFAEHKFHKNKVLIGIVSIAIIIGAFTFSKVQFNTDISALNYMPPRMEKSQKHLEKIGSIGSRSLYLAVYGDSLQKLLHENTAINNMLYQLQEKGYISNYTSTGGFLLSKNDQQNKINQWGKFWSQQRVDSTIAYVNKFSIALGFKEGTFNELDTLLTKQYHPISIEKFKKLELPLVQNSFVNNNGFLTLSTIIHTDSIHRSMVVKKLEKEDVVIIDRKHISEQFLGQIKMDFQDLMNYSLLTVFLLLLLFFRRIELALLGITPIILTGIVTMGVVYLLGVQLTIFSLIVTTLIIGVGVDFSIFMTSGLQKKYTTGKNELKTYRTSIILAVLTTFLSIGVLVFAKHPALKSISWVALIGMATALLVTFTFYPLLFNFCIDNRPKKGKSPASLRLFLMSVFSFVYYGIFSIIISLFWFILSKILPAKKNEKQLILRKIISLFFKSTLFLHIGIKTRMINETNETFDSPAVIMPNHTSFLDSLIIGYVPTKFIFLVKEWVYNSPIFGLSSRMSGDIPTTQNFEQGEKKLIAMVKKGYSLVIFPEGTRSITGAIGRFHKGAFLLAQKHQLDIVPIYIHGNSTLLPKGDFVIFDGVQSIVIGERITISSEEAEKNTKSFVKAFSKKYKDNYQQLRYQLEDENYFKQRVLLSFLYKSLPVVNKAKKEFQNYKSICHRLNPLLDEKIKLLRIGDDLGVVDLIVSLQKPKRKIYSYIQSTKNRAIAKQNYLIHRNPIHYIDEPVLKKSTHLLITISMKNNEIEEIIKENDFKEVIFSIPIDKEIIINLGYIIYHQSTDFIIFRQK